MRVAFIARSTLHTDPGGDTMQVLFTAKYLRGLGVEVDIKLSNETIDYDSYDLLHFFNIIRPADILKHAGSGKPYVVSTVFVDYTAYEKTQRKGWKGALFSLLSPGLIEYTKAVGRFLKGSDKLVSREYLWMGHNRSVRKILQSAACLLPNSESEYQRLLKTYDIPKKYFVVPYGVDLQLFYPRPGTHRQNDVVLCVGRIEGRKNQLNLIRAMNNTGFTLYLIGNPAPNQPGYYMSCKKEAGQNIIFINNLSQDQLVEYYDRATVHVLPSWFETAGLSSLEAAAMGCNIVISDRGDVKEYFGDLVIYCDPSSPASIRAAIEKAATRDANPALLERINSKFNWEQAAFITNEAYNAII